MYICHLYKIKLFGERSIINKILPRFVLRNDKLIYYLDSLIAFLLAASVAIVEFAPEISFTLLKINIVLFILRFLIFRNVFIPDKTVIILIASFVLIQLITSLFSNYSRESLYISRIRAYYYFTFFISNK